MLKTEVVQQPYVAFRRHVLFTSTDGFSRDESAFEKALGEVQSERAKDGISSQRRILIADDEQIIANTLTLILNQSGFEARAVYSGEAAIEALSTFQPDVLISDVVMPGMTGIETAIAVRLQRPSCKVLLFSGQAATADLLQDARAHGHKFEILAKPVHPTDLLAKLRTAIIH